MGYIPAVRRTAASRAVRVLFRPITGRHHRVLAQEAEEDGISPCPLLALPLGPDTWPYYMALLHSLDTATWPWYYYIALYIALLHSPAT